MDNHKLKRIAEEIEARSRRWDHFPEELKKNVELSLWTVKTMVHRLSGEKLTVSLYAHQKVYIFILCHLRCFHESK